MTRRAPQSDLTHGPRSRGREQGPGNGRDSGPALSPWPTCLWGPPRWPAHPRDRTGRQALPCTVLPHARSGRFASPPQPHGHQGEATRPRPHCGHPHGSCPGGARGPRLVARPRPAGCGVLRRVPGQQSRCLLPCWEAPGASCLFPGGLVVERGSPSRADEQAAGWAASQQPRETQGGLMRILKSQHMWVLIRLPPAKQTPRGPGPVRGSLGWALR